MLTINLVFILRKSVVYSVNLFSNRKMNWTSQLKHLMDGKRWIFCTLFQKFKTFSVDWLTFRWMKPCLTGQSTDMACDLFPADLVFLSDITVSRSLLCLPWHCSSSPFHSAWLCACWWICSSFVQIVHFLSFSTRENKKIQWNAVMIAVRRACSTDTDPRSRGQYA